ncbi:MAG: T9SS type A sorting domain-containing protein [Chlorobiales bacterium]|nr:T9SS type A sorting domain-containing protein [Chlorobiales bacterium]
MQVRKKISLITVLVLCLTALANMAWAKHENGYNQSKKKAAEVNSVQLQPSLDVNNIRAWVGNQAKELHSANGSSGFEWPINTGKTAVFIMSPWLACEYEDNSADVRTAAVQNIPDGSEFIPGKITQNMDGTIKPDESSKTKYRVYRIKSGDNVNTNADYRDWPFEDGAPYLAIQTKDGLSDSLGIDGHPIPVLDNSGKLQPKIFGDVTTWCVYNDMRQDARAFSQKPMGCEIQQTAFAFRRAGALGNMVFFKFRIINRNVPDLANPNKGIWKNTYFAIFSDHDLGELGDDLVGCDTTLGLGFTYNATNIDAVYGSAPPAVGVDFFKGPTIRNANGTSKTLGMTAFARFNNSMTADDSDPQTGQPNEVYNYLKGFDRVGHPLPGTRPGSKFMWPADPETEAGSQYIETGSGDKRQLIVTGPFNMAAGDTQEVVCAVLIAKGTSNKNSVTELKTIDQSAQAAFDVNFNLASPVAPKLEIKEFDNELVLSWGDENPTNPSYTPNIEKKSISRPGSVDAMDHYDFQGYIVYQYASPEGKNGTYKRIAVFDKADGIKEILDQTTVTINGATQNVIAEVVKGTDSGIQRTLRITKDELNNKSLYNGTRYYFGVSSYYVNPYQNALSPYPGLANSRTAEAFLESLEVPVVGVPQKPVAGTVLPANPGDQLQTNRLAKIGDDNVRLKVVDPTKIKDGEYDVKILDASAILWQLRNVQTNQVATGEFGQKLDSLKVMQNDSEAGESPIFNGVQVVVKNNGTGLRMDGQGSIPPLAYAPEQNIFFQPKPLTITDGGPSALELSAQSAIFGNASAAGTVWYPTKNLFFGGSPGTTVLPENLRTIEIEFTNDLQKQQYAYRYVLNINPDGKSNTLPIDEMIYDPSFKSFIDTTGGTTEKIFKKRPEGPFQRNILGNPKVPLRVFEIDPQTGARGRQLQVLFTERNDPKTYGGGIDGKWNPNSSQSGGQELLYITATTYNPSAPDTTISQYRYRNPTEGTPRMIARDQIELDIMYILWLRQIRLPNGDVKSFQEGDRIRITPNYKLSPSTIYRFNLSAIKRDVASEGKNRIDKITVFPNPYYGTSSRERFLRETLVTFTNLPPTCTIRIFTLSGDMVRTIKRKDKYDTSLEDWDLKNTSGVPVASGMYIIHVETPFGNKILKLAVIQREQREDYY